MTAPRERGLKRRNPERVVRASLLLREEYRPDGEGIKTCDKLPIGGGVRRSPDGEGIETSFFGLPALLRG